MSLHATLANLAWLAASVPAHRRFLHALGDPAATQANWLRAHLARNASTAYGRAHGCGEIRSPEEFARRIPIVDYSAVEPWIARIRRGETNVLTREPVTRLLPTSGSTDARKLIPFTATLQHEFNAAIGPWLVDLATQHPPLATGPAYWSITPMGARPDAEASAVPIGFEDDSRYLGAARAWLAGSVMAVPSSVRLIDDLGAFRRTVLRHLLRHPDLRLISVWHPSFLTLLLDTLVREWDAIVDGLPDGKRLRRADPTRPHTLWPNLRVVSCWADGHAAGPAAELRQRLAGTNLQPKGLLATEAFITVPFANQHPLAIRSHFFEFIDEHGRVQPAAALRADASYEVIVTTGGGLWRYRMGDRVEVTGFVNRTPSLRFLGRGDDVSDRCGEKISEAFAAKVLAALCPAARFAMLAPEESGGAWRYVLFIESEDEDTLPLRLDAALQANPHYALCRRLGQLSLPRIMRIAPSGYSRYVAAEMARGRRLGDLKAAALSRRSDWPARFEATAAVAPLPTPASSR